MSEAIVLFASATGDKTHGARAPNRSLCGRLLAGWQRVLTGDIDCTRCATVRARTTEGVDGDAHG